MPILLAHNRRPRGVYGLTQLGDEVVGDGGDGGDLLDGDEGFPYALIDEVPGVDESAGSLDQFVYQ